MLDKIKPIYYYEHPFALPRGGVDKTEWVWKGNKCFCHHSKVYDLFLSDEIDKEFTLFTEAADMMYHFESNESVGVGFPHLPSLYSIRLNKIPKTLKKWYSTNVCISNSFFDINCCPIGIYDGYHNNKNPTRIIEILMSKVDHIDKKTLCLMNFNINNRSERYDLHHAGKLTNWVTVLENKDIEYGQVLIDILHSKFVVCPISNGIETSRIWESVYLGAIPIVIQSEWSKYFNDLPILQIPNWNFITKEFLEKVWFQHISLLKNNYCPYNYNKIDANHWKKLTESI